MNSNETAVFDPIEFAVNRTELPLDDLGLYIVSADWGDSQIELFLVRQALGEIPADRHPPNRTITITLGVKAEGAVTLATAAQKLQQKIGLFQREDGGWVRRDMDTDGMFASSVGFPVMGASLAGLDGWTMAHRQQANNVVVTLTAGPYCYGTNEIASTDFVETVQRDLTWSLSGITGSAPGLIRIVVDNDNAPTTGDWFSVISAIESRDSSGDVTAALSYEAELLTLLGGSTVATLTGASGGGSNNAVKSPPLNSIFQAVLGSKIVASKLDMTHIGNRRFFARVYNPSGSGGFPGDTLQMRLDWRVLGTTNWSSNPIISKSLYYSDDKGFWDIDFGECRIQTASLGLQRWEWRIVAKTTGTAGQQFYVDKVYPLPAEQFMKVSCPVSLIPPTLFMSWDEFDQTAGNLDTPKIIPGGVDAGKDWYEYNVVGADGFQIETGGHTAQRTSIKDYPAQLGCHAIAGTGVPVPNTAAQVDIKVSYLTEVQDGVILRFKDVDNMLIASTVMDTIAGGGDMGIQLYKVVAKVITPIAFQVTPDYEAGKSYTVASIVTSGGIALVWMFPVGSTPGDPIIATQDNDLAFGNTLDHGRNGMDDFNKLTDPCTRNLDNFASWVPDINVACSAGRSMEISTEGVYRQDLADDVWGRLTPDGFLPYAPPAGLEGRTARGIIIPSQGILDQTPDAGSNKLSATVFYYPGYHFASEST